MKYTISDILETVTNPAGRFLTLGPLQHVAGPDGEPAMALTSRTVRFEIETGGGRHMLVCDRAGHRTIDRSIEAVSAYTRHIDTPYLTEYVLRPAEMLVFDEAGGTHTLDVVLHRMPAGERLDRFIAGAAEAGNRDALLSATAGLARMARWLNENNFSHNNLSSRNIVISPSLTPVLINYEYAERKPSADDIRDTAALAAMLYIVACHPAVYHSFIAERIRTVGGLRRCAAEMSEMPGGDDLIAALLGRNGTAETADLVNAVAEVGNMGLRTFEPLAATDARTTPDFGRRYTNIGRESCSLVRAMNDAGLWCYIDRNGCERIGGGFLGASDFTRGAAVVETRTGFGVIDTQGRYIVEATADDIQRDVLTDVFIVTRGGRSGLYSSAGRPLGSMAYDQIFLSSEGRFMARADGLFGYLSVDGAAAVPLRYDDAFSFEDGFARVRLRGTRMLIDPDGNEIGRF